MVKCKCDLGIGNTGMPKGANCMGIISSVWFQQKYDSTGARNGITIADFGTLADIVDYFTTETTKDKRLYPIKDIEEYAGTDGEPASVTHASGRLIKLADGIRAVSFFAPDVPAILKGKVANLGCGEWQYFTVDVDGNVAGGDISSDGLTLLGYEFDEQSWNTPYQDKSFTDSSRLTFNFNWVREQKVETIHWVSIEEMASGFVPTQQGGLIDVNVKYVPSATTTTAKVTAQAIDGRANPVNITGLSLAAFVVYNKTDEATITPSGVTETDAGVYTLTFTAQTSADVITVGVANDTYESVESVEITIP